MPGPDVCDGTLAVLAPFGTVLIAMLKMVVIPIIFLSLVTGAASLPLRKFGRLGMWVVAWYFLTSLFAAVFGTGFALFMNPGMGDAGEHAAPLMGQVEQLRLGGGGGGTLLKLVNDLFMNPFQALAEGKFLSIIVFSILFGHRGPYGHRGERRREGPHGRGDAARCVRRRDEGVFPA